MATSNTKLCVHSPVYVESFLAIDTKEDNCRDTVTQIGDAIAFWRSVPPPAGAFAIRTHHDVSRLLEQKILCTQADQREFQQAEREVIGTGLPSLVPGWKPPATQLRQEEPRRPLGDLIDSADVELTDECYRVQRYRNSNRNDKNVISIVINVSTGQEVRPQLPFLRRIIDEKMLPVSQSRETKPGNRQNRTLAKHIITALKDSKQLRQ